MRLDGPLLPGSRGGHGPIRYRVFEVGPERVSFQFEQPELMEGVHYFYVREAPEGCEMGHVIQARSGRWGWLLWPLAVRWLHDALVGDALDCIERELTGSVKQPNLWSPWVKVLRWIAKVIGFGEKTEI